ncbi:MAG: glucokinase [Rectinemataceae bacterium]
MKPSAQDHTVILAGDIGGTNTNLALVEIEHGHFSVIFKERYSTQAEKSLIEPLGKFLEKAGQAVPGLKPELCCISAAGLVTADSIELTNAPWSIYGSAITSTFGFPVRLINDFTAVSYGVILLDPSDPSQLSPLTHLDGSLPPPRQGASLVIGAGTGLGVGYVLPIGERKLAFPSEGGHFGLPCHDALSRDFAAWMQARIGYPPGVELGVSGQGIGNIFSFVCSEAFEPSRIGKNYSIDAIGAARPIGPAAAAALAAPEQDRPALVAAACAKGDPHCRLTMEIFVTMYARTASDLSAVFLPYSGVYLAGGIASKNESLFRESNLFMRSYETNYARHIRELLSKIPVMIVRDYSISLIGAANAAVSLA